MAGLLPAARQKIFPAFRAEFLTQTASIVVLEVEYRSATTPQSRKSMQKIQSSRTLDVAPEFVYSVLTQVSGYARWLAGCSAATLESGEDGTAGSIFLLKFSLGAFSDSERLVLAEADAETGTVVLSSVEGKSPLKAAMTVTTAPQGSRFTLEFGHNWQGRVLGVSVTGPLFRLLLGRLLDQSVPRLVRTAREASAAEEAVPAVRHKEEPDGARSRPKRQHDEAS